MNAIECKKLQKSNLRQKTIDCKKLTLKLPQPYIENYFFRKYLHQNEWYKMSTS